VTPRERRSRQKFPTIHRRRFQINVEGIKQQKRAPPDALKTFRMGRGWNMMAPVTDGAYLRDGPETDINLR
jgi:hypothetical protein